LLGVINPAGQKPWASTSANKQELEQIMIERTKSHYEVIVIGAGVAGIYQIKLLADLGVDATVLDAAGDLGGTWYWNRYPGARFDSESYTYGFSFSKELLNEWHWKERFSGQPENLR
jgi:cation diffusion facilitator CzcD-associated flavoprotein CzcO